MTRLPLALLIAVPCLASGPGPLPAQEGAFAFELRGGGAIPLSTLRTGEGGWSGETQADASFGMGFTFPAPGPFGLFLGFGQRRFGCGGEDCPRSSTWISTGFDVALRLVIGTRRIRPWLKGGFHSHRLEGRVAEEMGAPVDLRSDGGAGYEVGGGLLIAIGERTSLSPGVHFGSGTAPFPDRSDMRLKYLVADVGLVLGF